MGNAIEPKHHGPDQQCRTVPLTGGGSKGGNSYSTPTCIGHHPSTSCGVWPQNNRSLREYPIFAHFGSASGLER